MSPRKKAPELTFQQHIANFLIRAHRYGVLDQTDITDTEHLIAEDQLWAFLNRGDAGSETIFSARGGVGPNKQFEMKGDSGKNTRQIYSPSPCPSPARGEGVSG